MAWETPKWRIEQMITLWSNYGLLRYENLNTSISLFRSMINQGGSKSPFFHLFIESFPQILLHSHNCNIFLYIFDLCCDMIFQHFVIRDPYFFYTFFLYRQLGCLALSLRFWPKIKQFLSNCPASDWIFSFKTSDLS